MTRSQLQKMIREEIDNQINGNTLDEGQLVIDLKTIARNMVRDYFSTNGPMGPTIRSDGKELNRFRAEMEQQIAGAMKGVIRRWGRGNFFIGDPSKIWADPDLKKMKPDTRDEFGRIIKNEDLWK